MALHPSDLTSTSSVSLILLISLFSVIIINYTTSSIYNRNRKLKPLPGPPGLPLLGNLHQIPKTRPWIQMAKWTKAYGPIYRLKMGFSTLVVLGSPKVAIDILDQRSSKFSSRPRHIMTSEHVSRGLRMTFMPYNDLWRRERRLLHLLTQPKAAASYEPIQAQESAQLCLDLLDNPGQHWRHAQRYAGSTVLQIAFSRRALKNSDPAITQMRDCNEKMTQTAVPGRYLVDSVPLLDYLPTPLAPWKTHARVLFDETLSLFAGLYHDVVAQMRRGSESVDGCFAARIEALKDAYELTDDQAIFLAGAMFGAGSDTTADAIETFIFACTVNPEKMSKAQAELDRVVGRARLPEFADEEALVYCNAVVRELLRWRTVIAGGLAHMSTEDEVYEGYLIPKGTAVIANHWALHLDEETYKEPEKFEPERFIDPTTGKLIGTKWSERGHHAYGFGRRICPGLHIANRSLFITFTRILWTCSISATGPVDPDAFSSGFSSHPLSYPVKIEPRGEWVREVVEEAVELNGMDHIKIE